ncbi:ATPase family AAA domain-containing protein 2-like [Porphyrio hochstetteri]
MRPSIIFFDEIDGLAPVRSNNQDHLHSSIVTTLLALMDGFDSRGEVVVIGATNRLDSIDPALRRPGRFDREFLFSLPDTKARKEILEIHTQHWSPKPPGMLLEELADKCVGSLNPVLRNEGVDSDEESPSTSEEMPPRKKPRREERQFLDLSRTANYQPMCSRPRFLLVGEPGYGQTSHLAPAVIHALHKFPIYTLDLPALFAGNTSLEEKCAQVMREAQRKAPSIIYIPQIHLWWKALGDPFQTTFTSLLQDIPAFAPVLLLATSDVCYTDLPKEIQELFPDQDEVFNVQLPHEEERRRFFEDLLLNQAAKPPESISNADALVHPGAGASCSRVGHATGVHRGPVIVDDSELRQLLTLATVVTKNSTVFRLERLYAVLAQCIYQHREDYDKTQLVKEMKKEIEAFRPAW